MPRLVMSYSYIFRLRISESCTTQIPGRGMNLKSSPAIVVSNLKQFPAFCRLCHGFPTLFNLVSMVFKTCVIDCFFSADTLPAPDSTHNSRSLRSDGISSRMYVVAWRSWLSPTIAIQCLRTPRIPQRLSEGSATVFDASRFSQYIVLLTQNTRMSPFVLSP